MIHTSTTHFAWRLREKVRNCSFPYFFSLCSSYDYIFSFVVLLFFCTIIILYSFLPKSCLRFFYSAVYTVKHEYESEDEDKPRKIVELGPRKYEGIGPTTKEGLPIGLRTVRSVFISKLVTFRTVHWINIIV